MNIIIGKLSQNQMKTKVEFVRHQDRLTELFSDTSLNIKSCFAVADGCLQVVYEKRGFKSKSKKSAVHKCLGNKFSKNYFGSSFAEITRQWLLFGLLRYR